jgi:hypothetical protein
MGVMLLAGCMHGGDAAGWMHACMVVMVMLDGCMHESDGAPHAWHHSVHTHACMHA